MSAVRIVFPEYNNSIIQEAIKRMAGEIVAIEASSLRDGCEMVSRGDADAIVAGIDYTSRDVILAARDYLGVKDKTFSASFLMQRQQGNEWQKVIIADAAACKNPTAEQLFDIACQTHETALATLDESPRLAFLSFSTFGSGGHDPSMDKIQEVLERLHKERPDIIADGEMQLDAAINPTVGAKKAPHSEVAGRANVLMCPDLNSGNILYKSLEQFGGFVAAGPILQGFKSPISDLSRGSSVEDVILVIETMKKLVKE